MAPHPEAVSYHGSEGQCRVPLVSPVIAFHTLQRHAEVDAHERRTVPVEHRVAETQERLQQRNEVSVARHRVSAQIETRRHVKVRIRLITERQRGIHRSFRHPTTDARARTGPCTAARLDSDNEIEVIHIPHRNVILRGRRSVNITRHERQHDVSEPVTGKYGVILRIADMFLRDGLSRLDQPAEEMSVVFLGYFNHRLFGFDVADKNTTRAARGCTDCRRDRCGRNDDSFHGFHTTPPLLQTPCRQPPSCSTPLPADRIWSGSGYRFPP